jgi:LysR family transcriptional regulator, nitrogen assimilation regulatory protein
MDFRQLRYFVVVAELENFTHAASRLRVAQSAVSRQVQLLELELKTELFERVGRGIKLTAAGEMLRDRAKQLLDQVEHIRSEIGSRGNQPTGLVRIGANPSLGNALFPGIAERYSAAYPNVRLHFITQMTTSIQEAMQAGKLDLGIVAFPDKDSNLITTPLATESLYLMAARDSNLRIGPECTVKQVAELPLLLPGLPNRERLGYERLAAAKGFTLNCRMEADSLPVLKDLARRGLGYLLLPYVAMSDEDAAGWRMSRIRGLEIQRYVIRLANRPSSAAVSAAIHLIQDEVGRLKRAGVIR